MLVVKKEKGVSAGVPLLSLLTQHLAHNQQDSTRGMLKATRLKGE
jgi:hypothetical protein